VTSSLAESLGGGSPIVWAADWLVVAGFPTTVANNLVVESWEYAESGGGGGMWNPLNTTQQWPGAVSVNSAGVKNYQTRVDGLAANAHVIHNGLYGPVVAAFQRGDDAAATVQAIVTSPWGTRHIDLRGSVPAPAPHPAPVPAPPKPKAVLMPMVVMCPKGGYWICHADGAVFAYGGAPYHGGANQFKRTPGGLVTSMASTSSGNGYWQMDEGGGLYGFGDAHELGHP
jgi:hypothetical protein